MRTGTPAQWLPKWLREHAEEEFHIAAELIETQANEASALRKRVEELAAPFDRGDGLDGRISWDDLEREFSRRQDLARTLTEGGNNAL